MIRWIENVSRDAIRNGQHHSYSYRANRRGIPTIRLVAILSPVRPYN